MQDSLATILSHNLTPTRALLISMLHLTMSLTSALQVFMYH